MSMVYCKECNRYIDTDWDLEHFSEDLEQCIESEHNKLMYLRNLKTKNDEHNRKATESKTAN